MKVVFWTEKYYIFNILFVAGENRSHVIKTRKLWYQVRCMEFWYNTGKSKEKSLQITSETYFVSPVDCSDL